MSILIIDTYALYMHYKDYIHHGLAAEKTPPPLPQGGGEPSGWVGGGGVGSLLIYIYIYIYSENTWKMCFPSWFHDRRDRLKASKSSALRSCICTYRKYWQVNYRTIEQKPSTLLSGVPFQSPRCLIGYLFFYCMPVNLLAVYGYICIYTLYIYIDR